MNKTKIIFILISILMFLLIIFFINITIASLWAKIHVNSLIGFQKIIEIYDANIWYNFIIPILNIPIYLLYIFLNTLVYYLFFRKY